MRNDRRQFFVYDLEIGAKKKGAKIPTMEEILPVFEGLRSSGQVYPIRSETATMVIGDLQIDLQQNLAIFLIRMSDTLAPNSVYSDHTSGFFNEHKKSGKIGSDKACHVIVSTVAEAGMPNIYTCIIEKIDGLSTDLVQRILSKFLNYEYGKDGSSFYSYPHPAGGVAKAGGPRTDRCCPHIELRGRASDSLISDINAGYLTGISLIRAEPVTPFGGEAFLEKKRSELKLAVNKNFLPVNIWDSLVVAFKQSSSQYQSARVSYKVPGLRRTVTVEIDANTGSVLSDMYVLSFEVSNLSPQLAESAINIVPHLVKAAVPQFIANRKI